MSLWEVRFREQIRSCRLNCSPWQIPEGEFTLSIRSPLWPAAFIAEGDSRMLGLAVSRIIFMEKV